MSRLYRSRYTVQTGTRRPYRRKKRPQRVRFRKRYAASTFKRSLIKFSKISLVAGAAMSVLWVGREGRHFWNTSPLLKVTAVDYIGFIPPGLTEFLGYKSGMNIFWVRPAAMRRGALRTFPELRNLDIERRWDRSVVVRGTARRPLAAYGPEENRKAVDETGTVFPLTVDAEGTEPLARVDPIPDESIRIPVARLLAELSRSAPEFYSTLKFVKTDKINSVILITDEGVTIYWGTTNLAQADQKSNRIAGVFQRFHPADHRATLRFVEADRVVLNSYWIDKK